MASSAGGERSFERIQKICQAAADTRTLRLKLLEEIRRVVPFDAYAWLLTDPATSVGSSPLADVPCLPELPRLIRLKYLTEVNRWTRLTTSVALLGEATAGVPSRSRVWRELLARYDITESHRSCSVTPSAAGDSSTYGEAPRCAGSQQQIKPISGASLER